MEDYKRLLDLQSLKKGEIRREFYLGKIVFLHIWYGYIASHEMSDWEAEKNNRVAICKRELSFMKPLEDESE